MVKHIALAIAVVAAGGCGKKKSADDHDNKGMGSSVGSGVGSGSGSGSGHDMDVPQPIADADTGMGGSAAMIAPITPIARAKRFTDCWALWTANDLDKLASCYALDATSEAPGSGEPAATTRAAIISQVKLERSQIPDQHGSIQLEIGDGSTIIAVVEVAGTPAGGQPTGLLAGVVTEFNDRGEISHERTYLDAATVFAQAKGGAPNKRGVVAPGAFESVVADNSETPKQNQETVQKFVDAFGRHDEAALAPTLADAVTWSDQTAAKDTDKAGAQALWSAITDAKLDVTATYAAGSYVADVGSIDGMKSGKPVSLPVLAIFKLADKKIASVTLFYQSAPSAQSAPAK